MPLAPSRLAALAACLLAAAPVAAQAPPDLPLQLDLDYAAFDYGEATALLETYLAFGVASLPYRLDSARYVAAVPVHVALRRSSTAALDAASVAPVWADTVEYRFAVPDTAGLDPADYFVQQLRAAVPPGEYELEVAVPEDPATERASLTLRRDVTIPDYGAGVALSDLTLASAIARSDDRASPFYKNGLFIQPNPNALFGRGLDEVYYYAEAYGLDEALDAGTYTLFAYVAPANLPQPLEGLQQRSERAVQSPDVLAGAFDVGALPSGSYYLRLALLDAENEALAEHSRKFFVYNPGVAAPVAEASGSYLDGLYAAMPAEEVEENLRHADVVASGRERDQMRGLASLEAQRDFLVEFWRRRDPNPATPINEARRDFYERLQYAADRYANAYNEGWETDRGRVVLKYGYPSAVEPRLYESNTIPHEIWEYDNISGLGQGLFVFADRTGFGEFDLIHSNVTGEISMPNWQEQLRR